MLNTRLHSKIYKLLQELDQAGSLAAILENSSFLLDPGLLDFLDLGHSWISWKWASWIFRIWATLGFLGGDNMKVRECLATTRGSLEQDKVGAGQETARAE